MFDYLIKLDVSVITRYRTLEINIKSKSNSFYDAFLDLLEATIKNFLTQRGISFDPTRTCGFLLRDQNIEDFFKQNIGLDTKTYEKLIDYTKKANDHKHKGEKFVGIDTVINFMQIFYSFSSLLAIKQGAKEIGPFNADYFNDIFGLTEKQNIELKDEVSRLKEELSVSVVDKKMSELDSEKYKTLLSAKQIEAMTLDEQNQELRIQLSTLKDIKLNSMEEKLNKTIDLLNELQDYLVESRVISYGVGLTIIGKEGLDQRIESARKMIKEKKNG